MTENATMPTHWFTVAFERAEPLPADITDDEFGAAVDALANDLYEAGCDDAVVCVSDGAASASFHREAATRDEAVASATAAIERCGCRVTSVVDDEPL